MGVAPAGRARKEAKQAMAIRRSRFRDRRNQNGKPGDRRCRAVHGAIVNALTLAGVSGEWVQPHF